MAETPSNMIPLMTQAPEFSLPDAVSEKIITLNECRSEIATVIMFICNHCPYVKHIQQKLVEVVKHYQAKGISFVAISANDVVRFPQDGPAEMKREAEAHGYTFPYLYDETQEVAKAYQAACTPDFYIFDKELKCIYRGRFDDASPGNDNPVTGGDLCHALDNVLTGKPVAENQKNSIGCNIKWKKD